MFTGQRCRSGSESVGWEALEADGKCVSKLHERTRKWGEGKTERNI